jgi:hypothetical protein
VAEAARCTCADEASVIEELPGRIAQRSLVNLEFGCQRQISASNS